MLSLALALAGSCIYHDKCIGVEVAGIDHCITVTNATGTLNGQPGVPIQNELVYPQGCKCLDAAEQEIFNTGPACGSAYDLLRLELELLARQDCVTMAQTLGFTDENCLTVELDQPVVNTERSGSCVAYVQYEPGCEGHVGGTDPGCT